MPEEESVRVAVRVRPFNSREKERNAKLVISMKGKSTTITEPSTGGDRKFAFDYSYWSHDGFKKLDDGYLAKDTSQPNGNNYAEQNNVFDDLGRGVLANAWEGYNSSLFAYGQTGSGKSWSVVGYGTNRGIVPKFCDTIFTEIAAKTEDAQYEVSFSMLEIYCEVVRDLLDSKSSNKHGLKIRFHPKKGFYVEKLRQELVANYQDIEKLMELGTSNRTVASTKMNATSSRAHTIVTLKLVQKYKNAAGQETAKSSITNLVDLAGSERAENTGATGDRLKEGAAINLSLSSLGNVISALAEQAEGKNIRVPFRDSALTKLLMNALGGNSKTIMIAAISPADINYDESLSTLRYADRAKQIKCKVQVNEDPTEKLIRELNEENDRLKKLISEGGIDPAQLAELGGAAGGDMSNEELDELKKEMQAEMEENEREVEEMKKQYEQKLAEMRTRQGGAIGERSELNEKAKTTAHFYNLNMDMMLTGNIKYLLDKDKLTIGDTSDNQIEIFGPSIQDHHAVVVVQEDRYFIEPVNEDAMVYVNGNVINGLTELFHYDRIVFGNTQYYTLCIPSKISENDQPPQWLQAQEEINGTATKKQLSGLTPKQQRDQFLLEEDLAEMIPAVEEANAISSKLDKKMRYECVPVTGMARGEPLARTMPFVHVENFEDTLQWWYDKRTFLAKQYTMKDIYDDFKSGKPNWDRKKRNDPFYESPDTPFQLGTVNVPLKALSHQIELKETLKIVGFKGDELGTIDIELVPCDGNGREYTEKDDKMVENPKELIGKPYYLVVKVGQMNALESQYEDIYCRYKFEEDVTAHQTTTVKGTHRPNFKYKKIHKYETALNEENLKYLMESSLMIQVWTEQKHPKKKETKGKNTKELMKEMRKLTRKELKKQGKNKKEMVVCNSQTTEKTKDIEQNLNVMTALHKRLEVRLNNVKYLIDQCNEKGRKMVAVELVRDVWQSSSGEEARKIVRIGFKKDNSDTISYKSSASLKSDKINSNHATQSSTCILL
ncbi:hypothetical protein SNEBB_001283 [Seison nebaliae]|nr:hypothetical protein SNEBB_001283 [Seison nebaliae]